MYFVYVLKSMSAKKSYVGHTDNLDRRLEEHNSGKSNFTSRFLPWELIYKEEFHALQEAVKREKYLKSQVGRKFLKTLFK
jgi:putative endonuclease